MRHRSSANQVVLGVLACDAFELFLQPSSPALKQSQILELQLLKFRWTPQIEFGRAVAVIDGREIAVRSAKVGKNGIRLIPVLKWQFPLHALVVRLRH